MRVKKTEKKVYDYLLTQIERGTLGPNSKIVEQDVAHQLGVSRSPVRSALLSLETQGFIKLIPYKGAVVLSKQLDSKSYVEQLKVFELLFVQYLFQVETKKSSLPYAEMAKQLKLIAQVIESQSKVNLLELEVELLGLVLSEQSNSYYKSLLLDIIKGILATNFTGVTLPEEDSQLLFFEHFKQLISYLEQGKEPQGRREIRILVNNLTLAVIDKQDLGQLNKYES